MGTYYRNPNRTGKQIVAYSKKQSFKSQFFLLQTGLKFIEFFRLVNLLQKVTALIV